MANSISVDEFALLEFFEVLPVERDEGVCWFYNDSVYAVAREPLRLSFAVTPAMRDVRLIVRMDEGVLYELNAMSIVDVKIHDVNGHGWLELVLSERQTIQLRIKPAIAIYETIAARD